MEVYSFDVVTTYAQRHWESHAKRCVESFLLHWTGIPIRKYVDEDLEQWSDWLAEFKIRQSHRDTSNYRFDAVRFAHKVAAIELAFKAGQGDYLIWMDADCVTHADVDREWLSGLIQGKDFGLLTRENKYSECGFMFIRRNKAGAEFVRNLVWLYRTDELFELAEWHDSWAIDHVRNYMERNGQLSVKSLSGGASKSGHPFINGPLGERMDHCKGKRKQRGKSNASDLTLKRKEAYWK